MSFTLPPIAKAAERLLLDIEQAVSRFPRTHRYTAGESLRQMAMTVAETTHRAWRERRRQAEWAYRLVWAIDALKIRLQLCSQLRAAGVLTSAITMRSVALAAAQSAAGIGVLICGRPDGRAARLTGCRSRYANPVRSPTLIGVLVGGSSTNCEHTTMTSLFPAASAAVTPFSFRDHAVRVVLIDGEPWFVASDIAEVLGYRDARDAGRNLPDRQKGTQIVRTLGGPQKMTIVSEGGMYRLVLRSRKPEAEAFTDWVTDEVLQSIRKTGGYGVRQPVDFIAQARAQSYGNYLNQVLPDDVAAELERKCWALTAEAGTAIREYLIARIVTRAQPGNGSRIDRETAHEAIDPVTLDVALGPHDASTLDSLLSMADCIASSAQQYAAHLRAGAGALFGHRPAVAALLSANAASPCATKAATSI